MKVYVELAGADVGEWARRHARGEVPDATPYGLHRLERAAEAPGPADAGEVSVRFQQVVRSVPGRWLSRTARNHLGMIDPVPALLDRSAAARADVVLCMDERSGVPAALLHPTPVVSGINWVEPHPPRTRGRARAGDRVVRHAISRMAGVFSQSDALVAEMRRAGLLAPERIHHVRLGIDADFYRPAPWPATAGRVFSVGDDRMRDHATLVRAMRLVRDQGVPAELDLATTLPVDLPADLGRVHGERLDGRTRDFYAAAEVVAVATRPNIHGSGLTALLEAMASARPVVISGNPGMERYVQDGVTGLLVPPGDPQAMADAVAGLLADPDRARRMGLAARQRVEAELTTEHQAQDMRRVLRLALAG